MNSYNQVDQYLHQASQLLAKAGRKLVLPQADGSHTNCYFDPITKTISTHPFKSEEGIFRLVFDIENNVYSCVNYSDKLALQFTYTQYYCKGENGCRFWFSYAR